MNSALGGRAQAHFPNSAYTVELPRATTFRKRPHSLSDCRFKIPQRSRSKPKSWSFGWGGWGGGGGGYSGFQVTGIREGFFLGALI